MVKIFKDFKEFEDLGIYCLKGVFLYGFFGIGKILFVKVIVGEVGVFFFFVSGVEFVEVFFIFGLGCCKVIVVNW